MSFRAKYRGTCVSCEDDIYPGQNIEYDFDGEIQHALCPESLRMGKPKPVCPRCFMELPVIGKCGECFPDD